MQPKTTQPARTVRIPQYVVHKSFVSETVVLNLETGKYHGLNATAGRMLEELDRLGDVDDVIALLAEEFRVPSETLRADVHEFCEEMTERGLLEIVSRGDH